MYFDFEDAHPETPTLTSPISRREGILLSIIAHLVITLLIVLAPKLPFVQAIVARQEAEAEQRRAALLEQQRRERPRFVFVQPRVEMPPPRTPAPRPELSDRDRLGGGPESAENPTNTMPFSRGNTSERVDIEGNLARRMPQPPEDAAAAGGGATAPPLAPAPSGSLTIPRESSRGAGRSTAGVIGDALRNIQRYATGEKFQNLGGAPDQNYPTIQFDTKGVEFGPWIRRFVAQVKRNWFIPYAAMTMHGHVVLTFYVHRDGRISELTLRGPSDVDAFNNAAYNALAWSNPTQPLPDEYPDDRAFFTVTFFYNEQPPQD
ncbi:MAG TPA: TonB C-terminal domain-containing protein [Vicinamibacterales bacterium]|nr:TonB C-terminal domain-containing protein [Vicinamibacterales bacterium]